MIKEPYKINDDSKKSYSFRPLNKSNNSNIRVNPFVPDKIRITNYVKEHKNELKYYNDRIKKMKKNYILKSALSNDSFDFDKYDILKQPSMKFKPRTDLERVIESVNYNNSGKADPELLKTQLKKLGLLTVSQNIKYDGQNEYSLLKEKFRVNRGTYLHLIKEKARLEKEERTLENEQLLSNINNIIKINKEIIRESNPMSQTKYNKYYNTYQKKFNDSVRKDLNNNLANKILEDYQKKTHFKALCTCSLDLNKSRSSNKSKIYSLNKELNYSDYFDLCPAICKKTFKQKIYDKDKLEYLKTLYKTQTESPYARNIFMEKQKLNVDDENDEQAKKILEKLNTIQINGISYKKSDLPKLSGVVLHECNYFKKSCGKENAGEGKTMITDGLTVNEFARKYKLPK